jgi:hypothetical protein
MARLTRSYPLTCRMTFVHRSTIGSTVSAFSGGNIGTTRVTPISASCFSRTGQMQIGTRGELEQLGNALLEPLFPVARGVRLLGISLSSLAAKEAEAKREFSLPL